MADPKKDIAAPVPDNTPLFVPEPLPPAPDEGNGRVVERQRELQQRLKKYG